MNLPPFYEFKDSITDERFVEICKSVSQMEIIKMVDGMTPENIGVLCERIVMQSIKSAFKLQMSLLEEYHEWLREQI